MKKELMEKSHKSMMVLDPLKLKIENFDDISTLKMNNHPFQPNIAPTVYIEKV